MDYRYNLTSQVSFGLTHILVKKVYETYFTFQSPLSLSLSLSLSPSSPSHSR